MEVTTEPHGRRNITIRTAEGMREITAVVFGEWAAHNCLGGWHVTHVPTGLCIPRTDLTEYQARRIALKLSEVVPKMHVEVWDCANGAENMTPTTVQREHVKAIWQAVKEVMK